MFGIKRLKERMDIIELINTDILQKLLEQKKETERLNAKLKEMEKLNAFLLMEKVTKEIDKAIFNEPKKEEKPAPKKKTSSTTTRTKKAVSKNGK